MNRRALALVLVLLLLAVGFYLYWETDREDPVDIDDEYIIGSVYDLTDDRVLVAEGMVGDEYTGEVDDFVGNAGWFRVDEETEIFNLDGDLVGFEDLAVGQKVSVWVTGVVLESYPVQAMAARIEILEEVEMEEFESYQSSDLGVSFEYPVSATVGYEEGMAKVVYIGEKGERVGEVTDGFVFYLGVEDLDEDLEEFVQAEFEERTEVLRPILQPEEKEVYGREAFVFEIEGGLGGIHTYFVFEEGDRAVIVSRFLADPEDKGYERYFEEFWRSIELDTDLVIDEEECYVGGCSSELCTDELEAISTCEYLPGAVCLRQADCESVEGECRWVLSVEAAECLMATEEEYGGMSRESRIGYLFEKAEELLD